VGLFFSNLEVTNFTISQNIISYNSTIFFEFCYSVNSKNLFFIRFIIGCIQYIIFNNNIYSEILCESSFIYFTSYSLFILKNTKFNRLFSCDSIETNNLVLNRLLKFDTNWLKWFIGFVEGDGSIFCDKKGRLLFIITQKEKAILYHIQSVLGFGNVYYDLTVKCWRFKVGNINNIFELAKIFNGNLFLDHRISQLDNWIKILNSKGHNLKFINKNAIITLQDAWLSGFCDAESCFNVTIYARQNMKVGFRVVLRFILDQNDKKALLHIRNLFGFGNVAFRNETANCYRFTADAFTKLGPVVDYFKTFPLRTIKNEAFIKWSEIREMMLKKDHTNFEGFEIIKQKAPLVNDKSNLIQ
jgi:hypothetical protein